MTNAARSPARRSAAAVLLPLLAALLLVPLRGTIDNINTALLLTIPVLAVSVGGTRWTALAASATTAVSFDFFHTVPYYRLTMRRGADVLTALLLFAVGLISSELALRTRDRRALAHIHGDGITRIHAIAQLVARGERPEFVVIAVAAQLREVLGVDDVRFEPAPVGRVHHKAACARRHRRGARATWRGSASAGGGDPADNRRASLGCLRCQRAPRARRIQRAPRRCHDPRPPGRDRSCHRVDTDLLNGTLARLTTTPRWVWGSSVPMLVERSSRDGLAVLRRTT